MASLARYTVVIVAGMASMALEMSAARLLAPFFGTSLYIWGILIGLTLIYLTVGYWLGGVIADRAPRARVFYGITGAGALSIVLVGLLARPVLGEALDSTAGAPYGLFVGTVVGCLILFTVPVVLLGTVNPFAIRLQVSRPSHAGHVSGTVLALTTLGSLVGTFAAVFLAIPSWGVRGTLLAFGVVLLATAAVATSVDTSRAVPEPSMAADPYSPGSSPVLT